MNKTLHLTLKKKWFDMILSGEKKEEYREIKEFWATRLCYKIPVPWGGYMSCKNQILGGDYKCKGWEPPMFEDFTDLCFVNGCGNHRPRFTIELKGIRIGEGKPEWRNTLYLN